MSLEGYSSYELSREQRESIERERQARLEAERKRQEEELRKKEELRKQQGRDRVAYALKKTQAPRTPEKDRSSPNPGLASPLSSTHSSAQVHPEEVQALVTELRRIVADIPATIEMRVRPVITTVQACLEQASQELPTNCKYHASKLRSVRYQVLDAIESAARAQTIEDERYVAERREMLLRARTLAGIAVLDDDRTAALRIAEQLETNVALDLVPIRRHLTDLSSEIEEAQRRMLGREVVMKAVQQELRALGYEVLPPGELKSEMAQHQSYATSGGDWVDIAYPMNRSLEFKFEAQEPGSSVEECQRWCEDYKNISEKIAAVGIRLCNEQLTPPNELRAPHEQMPERGNAGNLRRRKRRRDAPKKKAL